MVMDARTGEVLHSRNADTRLHPASLTKMMTLYVAFEAVRLGEITMDTKVRISKKAASEPPSKLGLKAGQRIKLRYLVRAAAVKSANDAATAIGEAISGDEAAFTQRMARTAKALGMTRTIFKNAHGLTEGGHLSTARDMTIMGRRLFYDYPQYYNLFSRKTTHAGIKNVSNTNLKFLQAYRGADGIKTGYTRAAGFNLVASAARGTERIIVTVFGGRSTVTRNAKVAELMDLGFRRAPSRVKVRKPDLPRYDGGNQGKTSRTIRAVSSSPRPIPRPAPILPTVPMAMALKNGVDIALKEAIADSEAKPADGHVLSPVPRPPAPMLAAIGAPAPENIPASHAASGRSDQPASGQGHDLEIVTRISGGSRAFGITLGKFGSRHQAERMLLKTALTEIETLDEALRKVVNRNSGYEANFVGMTQQRADLACRRLSARGVTCATIGP
ncbi:MAG: D-alanyl-D-alanine carboxypeptidase family protein [Pseudomonadota bacterium]